MLAQPRNESQGLKRLCANRNCAVLEWDLYLSA
jgi:hypothetical protein